MGKKATLTVTSFKVTCPHCGNFVIDPYSGSLEWPIEDGDIRTVKPGNGIECQECNGISEIPQTVKNNKLPT